MQVEILESAHQDLLDGYWFYERQMSGLGDYFADTIYGEIGSLRLYAGIHVRHFGLYRVISRRFPYSIYYEIEDGNVRVYGVLDDRRDPNWLKDRLFGLREDRPCLPHADREQIRGLDHGIKVE